MQRVLRKRVFRSLRKHFVRYLMLGTMIALAIFLVVTIVGSGETLTRGTVDLADETNLEDGEFEVFVPLTESEIDHINDMGIDIEEQFYYDYKLSGDERGTVRIFKIRDSINKIHYISGHSPADKDEIVIEKRYAEEHGYEIDAHPADWDKYGKSAGYKRNQEMAEVADAVICFWDGNSKGTKHMVDIAKEKKLMCKVIQYK